MAKRQSKAAQAADLEVTQEAPTLPRPVDASGREIDRWGLPLNGPARAAALEALQLPDPNEDPDAWPEATPASEPVADADLNLVADGGANSTQAGDGGEGEE